MRFSEPFYIFYTKKQINEGAGLRPTPGLVLCLMLPSPSCYFCHASFQASALSSPL